MSKTGRGRIAQEGLPSRYSICAPMPPILACSRFYSVQGLGGMLVSKIDGDYNNVVGFPAASFFKWLGVLLEEEVDFACGLATFVDAPLKRNMLVTYSDRTR